MAESLFPLFWLKKKIDGLKSVIKLVQFVNFYGSEASFMLLTDTALLAHGNS